MVVLLACVSLIERGDKLVAIKSTKGHGITLPGGKWDFGETFEEAAARELKEETGLIACHQSFLFASFDDLGAYVYTFHTDVVSFDTTDSKEGEVVMATWDDLLKSRFKAYYSLLHWHLRQSGTQRRSSDED